MFVFVFKGFNVVMMLFSDVIVRNRILNLIEFGERMYIIFDFLMWRCCYSLVVIMCIVFLSLVNVSFFLFLVFIIVMVLLYFGVNIWVMRLIGYEGKGVDGIIL